MALIKSTLAGWKMWERAKGLLIAKYMVDRRR